MIFPKIQQWLHVAVFCGLAVVRLTAAEAAESSQAELPELGYELVWSDEFDGTVLDPAKWGHRALGPRRDAINSMECVELDGKGNLQLETKRRKDRYLTAMISTEGKFEVKFGYVECRVQLQQQLGHWSAFWLQSPEIGREIGNPAASGVEIDVFEYLRKDGDVVRHHLHWDGYREHRKSVGGKAKVPGLSRGWHRFGVLWTQDEYRFYVDGKLTWRTNRAISQRAQYLILSMEVGSWAGQISTARLPDRLTVDYVRVYQKKQVCP